MTKDLLEELGPKTQKKIKPKNYDGVCASEKAQVGDVVYMPSHPEVKMTVVVIHHCNRLAGYHPQEVTVQWLDANMHLTNAKVLAKTLLQV